MLNRHVNELMNRLEQVKDVGCCEIRWSELYRWYSRDRITKTIWQDVNEKWLSVCNEEEVNLLCGQNKESVVLVYGQGVTLDHSAWLDYVTTLAQK